MTTSSPRSALLVYAHPEPTSFAAALRRRAARELTQAGWTVEVSDLYAEGFNPVAGPGDFTAPSDPRRLHVQREQARLKIGCGGFASAPNQLLEHGAVSIWRPDAVYLPQGNRKAQLNISSRGCRRRLGPV